MLVFIYQAKHIRVVRRSADSSGQSKRRALGRIRKDTLEIPFEIESALTLEEKSELSSALDFYKRAAKLDRKAKALALPEQLRVSIDYLQNGASAEERRIIVAAVMEAVRELRRMSEQDSEGDPRVREKGKRVLDADLVS